ncbi:MAG TPA: acyltransferase [Flavisolibacter sp.]|nr:acyltransferase [Flavisolibacter sp.]
MEKVKNDTRLRWIDYARGIAIILVVYRHVFEGLKNTQILKVKGVSMDHYLYLEQANIFFFSFRMPLFFIVSGVFIAASLKKRGLGALMENKAKTILYPYFIWGIIQISIQILFSGFINSKKTAADFLYLLYSPREVEQFWYLYALFNVSILYAFTKSRTKITSTQQVALGLCFFLLSTLFSQWGVELWFINDILHYYLFLALGDSLAHYILKGKLKAFFYSWQALALLLLPFAFSQYYFLMTNIDHRAQSPKYLYVEYYQPFAFLLVSLTGCMFIITVSSLLDRYDAVKWLRKLGKHSLYIYVMHVIVFAAVRVILTRFLKVYNIPLLMIACISAGVIIPVLLYQLASKIGLKFLFTLETANKPELKQKAQTISKPQPTYGN